MSDSSKTIIIAHALPLVLSEDGKFRVLLGEKTVWKTVEGTLKKLQEILIQPFGGKIEEGESPEQAGEREVIDELNGIDETLARNFFKGGGLFRDGLFYRLFEAPSDVQKETILKIHCWGRRLLSQIPVSEKVGSEMKNPKWHTFGEVFDHKQSGTLTKAMAACYGARIYFDPECIRYLESQRNHPYYPLRTIFFETLSAIVRDQHNRARYTTDVHPDDRGLIELIRRTFPETQVKIPKSVTFECGKLISFD